MKITLYRAITGTLVVLWMAVIFLFSSQPAEQSGKMSGNVCDKIVEDTNQILNLNMTEQKKEATAKKIEFPVRKAAHMTEYAILGLLSFAFYRGILKKDKARYAAALLTAALYACTDEFHQRFSFGRSAEVRDVCVDTVGAAIGLLILYFILKVARKHCQKHKVNLQ